METVWQRDSRTVRLEFPSSDEAEAFLASAQRESGFLVTLPVALKLHEVVQVELGTPETTGSGHGRVAQVFDKGFGRFGTAFLVDDWEPLATPRAEPAPEPPATVVDPGPAQPASDEPEASVAADSGPAADGEMRGTSPIHAIKQMNPGQRSMLAMKANRTQRRILVRDNSAQVLQNLLANPYIESEEVLQIARSSHSVAPILQRIASDSRWSNNQEILAVIARHPKTPSLFAARLMPSLRTSDLRIMAKMSSGLREMTRKAALREYMRRTGQKI